MRIITIIVKEVNNREEANIEVKHSHYGKKSDLEFEIVKMLNEFLYMKVDEVAKTNSLIKPNNLRFNIMKS
jgi:ribosome biogenesis protein Nip4